MKISLIVCTFMRAKPLVNLLKSINHQILYPDQIIIVDGSLNEETKSMLSENKFENLEYYKVDEDHRGLTKQRNFGVGKVNNECEIICFLDDDIVLTSTYFKELINTYEKFPAAIGVGGYIINEVDWKKDKPSPNRNKNLFYYDGWSRKDGSRFVLRKKLGLEPDVPPAHLPNFSHGRSVSFLPPSGKIYEVEQFMGGVSSFPLKVLKENKFSEYFQGYGLYEDADFTLRLSKLGKLYVNTAAQLYHYHDGSGRPDTFKYGKMVVRNGWYIWRVKYPKPSVKARIKWHLTSGLLTIIRFGNAIGGPQRRNAFMEALGRMIGWISLWFNKPKLK